MSTIDNVEQVRDSALFKELVTRRARLAWSLMTIALVAYFTLIGLVAFWPALLREPIAPGFVTNIGIVYASGLIVLGWVLTWVYVREGNGGLDALNGQLLNGETK